MDTIYKLSFIVSNVVNGSPIKLTPPYTADDSGTDPDFSIGAGYNTVVSYSDKNQFLSDVPWTIDWLGNNGGDNLLEDGEKAEITVWLLVRDTAEAISSSSATSYWDYDANGASGMRSTGTILAKHDQFTMKVCPPTGAYMTIRRNVPSRLDAVMDLQ